MFQYSFDIKDKEKFLARLCENIDIACDYETLSLKGQTPTTEYFGKIERGKILFYKTIKGFLKRGILFKVTGVIDIKNKLTLKIFPFNFLGSIISSLLLLFFAVLILIKYNFIIGLAILIFTLAQFLFGLFIFQINKAKLITEIKTIIKEI